MVKIPSYLQKTPFGVFHFRIAIPVALRPYFGKREFKRSLETSDRREAIIRSRLVYFQVGEFFQRAKKGEPMDKIVGHPVHLTVKGFKKNPDGSVEFDSLEMDPNKPKEEKEQLEAFKETFMSTSDQHPPMVRAPFDTTPVEDIIEDYIKEKMFAKLWTQKTEDENRAVFNLFQRIIGKKRVNEISPDLARLYKETLIQLPPNINKIRNLRTKSIDEIVAMKHKNTMAVNTINKNINRMSSFFDWARKNNFVDRNYFEGLGLKKTKRADQERDSFESGDLIKIFSNEIFKELQYKNPYNYWVPLIGLYSGARINEICQLELDDLRQEDGVDVFDFNVSGDKTIKTDAGRRLVPIHSKLIEFGLLKYADQLRKKSNVRLFPDIAKGRDGYGQAASKFFGRLSDRCGVTESSKVFHSFRHTVVDILKQKSIQEKKVSAIVGHRDASMTGGRYGKPFKPSVLKPIIEELDFDTELINVKKWK